MKINFEGRDRTFLTIEEMVEKLKIEKPLTETDVSFVNRLAKRGETIYAGFNPFVSEIEQRKGIIFEASREAVIDRQNRLREEI